MPERNIAFLVILAIVLASWSCTVNHSQSPLVIACSANAQFAMDEMIDSFVKSHGIECQITTASSGKLTAQILQGAPYDVFVSADMKYPTTLHERDKTLQPPRTYASGKLVLWSHVEGIAPELIQLHSSKIKHIALANPLTAPYGQAAKQVIDNLGFSMEHRLVFGESISQVNQFVVSKSVEIGFTAKSVVVSKEMRGKGQWIEIDSKLHDPIQQGVVAIKNLRNHEEQSEKFISYILSDMGKKILEKNGFEVEDIK